MDRAIDIDRLLGIYRGTQSVVVEEDIRSFEVYWDRVQSEVRSVGIEVQHRLIEMHLT